jgi:hypothetical protein
MRVPCGGLCILPLERTRYALVSAPLDGLRRRQSKGRRALAGRGEQEPSHHTPQRSLCLRPCTFAIFLPQRQVLVGYIHKCLPFNYIPCLNPRDYQHPILWWCYTQTTTPNHLALHAPKSFSPKHIPMPLPKHDQKIHPRIFPAPLHCSTLSMRST